MTSYRTIAARGIYVCQDRNGIIYVRHNEDVSWIGEGAHQSHEDVRIPEACVMIRCLGRQTVQAAQEQRAQQLEGRQHWKGSS